MTTQETRIFHFKTRIVVSFKQKEGIPPKQDYIPLPRPITKSQSKNIFNKSIDIWKKTLEKLLYDKYNQAAINEAEGMGTDAYLKEFYMYDIKIEQINKKKTEEQIKIEINEYKKEREQELIRKQQKIEKLEQKRKSKLEKEKLKIIDKQKLTKEIPVIIDDKPTTIVIKKDLTTMDIVHISRLQKSINKLEKQKEYQEIKLNTFIGAIKRIEESGNPENLLYNISGRDIWIDQIDLTNKKIQKQKDAIENIKI